MIHAHTERFAGGPADTLVIGDGVIGLSIALELARARIPCMVAGATRPGAASTTAGGLLAPSVGRVAEPAQAFYDVSLAMYPAFVESLREFAPGLGMIEGLLVVNASGAHATDPAARQLGSADVSAVEPALAAPHGAAFYASDGAIDNERLAGALRAATESVLGLGSIVRDAIVRLEPQADGITAITEGGARIEARTVVLAAGAWISQIDGLPRPVPVEPVRGQMIALSASPLHHAIIGNGVYVVPRGHETLVGSTLERTGYDTATDSATIDRLRASATVLCPALGDARDVRAWAGLRPATPDMLPIIGRDPDLPNLVYACGHSKNGILLAPATAKAVAGLTTGRGTELDLSPFSISRFTGN